MKKLSLKQLSDKALTIDQQKNTKGGIIDIDLDALNIIDIVDLDVFN